MSAPKEFSVKAALDTYVATTSKQWDHDRGATIGASEIGMCARRLWYAKNDVEPDPDYQDRWGPKVRGTLYEDTLFVPAMRAAAERGEIEVYWTGDEQRTLTDGFLSATPDAIVVIDGECFLVDCKSIDPRVNLRTEKDEHAYQIQVQIGLVRKFTNWFPTYGILPYLDASFPDDVTEFSIPFDERIFVAAENRARTIMTADSAMELKPEGVIAGGKECDDHCPFRSRCRGDAANAHPTDKGALSGNDAEELLLLVGRYDQLQQDADDLAVDLNSTKNNIKELLRSANLRWTEAGGRKVNWQSRKGKITLDRKAMERDGIDLSKYEVEGDPYDVLVIK